LDVRW